MYGTVYIEWASISQVFLHINLQQLTLGWPISKHTSTWAYLVFVHCVSTGWMKYFIETFRALGVGRGHSSYKLLEVEVGVPLHMNSTVKNKAGKKFLELVSCI